MLNDHRRGHKSPELYFSLSSLAILLLIRNHIQPINEWLFTWTGTVCAYIIGRGILKKNRPSLGYAFHRASETYFYFAGLSILPIFLKLGLITYSMAMMSGAAMSISFVLARSWTKGTNIIRASNP